MIAGIRQSGTAQRLIAVTHEFSRTGAPIALCRQLRWLSSSTPLSVSTVGLVGGPLEADFRQIGEVRTLNGRNSSGGTQLLTAGLLRLGQHRLAHLLRRVVYRARLSRFPGADIVLFNSLESLALVDTLAGRVRIGYVHEFGLALEAWQERERRRLGDLTIDEWWVVSEEGRSVLRTTGAVDPDRIRIVPGTVVDTGGASQEGGVGHVDLRRRLGLADDVRLVLGSGAVHRRKGIDLFVQLAAELERRCPQPVACLWIGAAPDPTELRWLQSDLRRSGARNVHLLGELDDPFDAFAQADVFVCTSREDPLPLVVLEVGALGIPVASYDTGSIGRLLEAAGTEAAQGVVTHLDLACLTERVSALLTDGVLAASAAAQLRVHVQRFHDIEVVGPATWLRLVGDLEASGARSDQRISDPDERRSVRPEGI